MKHIFIFLGLIFAVSTIQASEIIIGDFVKNANGEIITTCEQAEAKKLCEQDGKRLPTPRELLKEAIPYGAFLQEAHEGDDSEEFDTLDVSDAQGNHLDYFFYTFKKYKAPDPSTLRSTWASGFQHHGEIWLSASVNGLGFHNIGPDLCMGVSVRCVQ
jgi:hypothetical protein